jgi:hypothetical protein
MGRTRQVTAIRHVLLPREDGSLPGLIEADDLGTYLGTVRDAGRGGKVLVADAFVSTARRWTMWPPLSP